jgi:hypothetical protein
MWKFIQMSDCLSGLEELESKQFPYALLQKQIVSLHILLNN